MAREGRKGHERLVQARVESAEIDAFREARERLTGQIRALGGMVCVVRCREGNPQRDLAFVTMRSENDRATTEAVKKLGFVHEEWMAAAARDGLKFDKAIGQTMPSPKKGKAGVAPVGLLVRLNVQSHVIEGRKEAMLASLRSL